MAITSAPNSPVTPRRLEGWVAIDEQARQKEAPAEPERRDPEHREIDLPGATGREGYQRDDVDPERVEDTIEPRPLDVVVGEQSSQQGLSGEQQDGDRDVLDRSALGGRD